MPLYLAHVPEADPSQAPWYESLKQPNSEAGCCSISDCRNAVERLSPKGYEVFIDKTTFGTTAPDAWVPVPEATILHAHDNPTGSAVVCWFMSHILCFIPASGA